MRRTAILTALLVSLFGARVCSATVAHMQKLPVATKNSCTNCHASNLTPSVSDLNPFGTAFKANGFRWDRTLAELRSDGDNCTNGFELGDQDGDGRLDAGIDRERYNPGEMDCTLQISEAAWAALKQLFR